MEVADNFQDITIRGVVLPFEITMQGAVHILRHGDQKTERIIRILKSRKDLEPNIGIKDGNRWRINRNLLLKCCNDGRVDKARQIFRESGGKVS